MNTRSYMPSDARGTGVPGRLARLARTASPLAAAVCLLAVGTPAAAVAPKDSLARLPAAARDDAIRLREEAGRIRSAVAGATFAGAVRGLLAAGVGGDASHTPTPLPDIPGRIEGRHELPDGLQAAVGGLEAAVRWAIGRLERVGNVPRPSAWQPLVRVRFTAEGSEPAVTFRRGSGAGTPTTGGASRVAALLASELDRGVPLVRAWAARHALRAGTKASGCDLVDRTPYLCVGSDADNTYTEDVALLIDLGGDDVYRNSAGGAPFPGENGSAVAVSVNVDVSGNDRYEANRSLTVGDAEVLVAQGAGFGAVGMLVDLAGDDEYLAEAPSPTVTHHITGVVAQGAGVAVGSGASGFGALFDLEGHDTYAASAPSGGGAATVAAQASDGTLCEMWGSGSEDTGGSGLIGCYGGAGPAFSLLLDRGRGDDGYLADAGTARGSAAPDPLGTAFRQALAQGYGWGGGVSVLSDDGGSDRFTARASASGPPADSFLSGGPGARAEAQAVGFGYLFEGEGPTIYEVDVRAEGMSYWNDAVGQAAFDGILDDLGGDDRYGLVLRLAEEREIVVDEGCGCDRATAFVDGSGNVVYLRGQGSASALLDDHAGNDVYEARLEMRIRAALEDRREAPPGPPHLRLSGFTLGFMEAQGAGGATYLLDGDGSDAYRFALQQEVAARGAAEHAVGAPVAVAHTPLWDWASVKIVGGQGSDGGVLLDAGGEGDTFGAEAVTRVTTAPDPDGAFASAPVPMFHGARDGAFLALGEGVAVLSSPSRPACPDGESRGWGLWTDCAVAGTDRSREPDSSSGHGMGFVPDPVPASDASLAFTPDTTSSGPLDHHTPKPLGPDVPDPGAPRLEAAVRLTDPVGQPVSGAVVHFNLAWRGRDLVGAVPLPTSPWYAVWGADAVTDADGVARARLPLFGTGWLQENYSSSYTVVWRVLATFDGGQIPEGARLRPSFAALPVTLL